MITISGRVARTALAVGVGVTCLSGLAATGSAAWGASSGAAGLVAANGGNSQKPSRLLDHPAHGPAAIRALGGDLPLAAQRNGRSPASLRALLRSDSTMWVDPSGLLFVKDPAPSSTSSVTPAPVTAGAAAPSYPYPDTFVLHSRPGAQRVIFLDFDGGPVSGTAWNDGYGIALTHPAFDLDGSPTTWSNAEMDAIQSVYDRVSEDYAPFEVDVTTQDPGTDALTRSSDTDPTYGTRVLISPSTDAASKICNNNCGGVAYIGGFSYLGSPGYLQPAWVFPQLLSWDTKYIAEAVSHEAGHTLGLAHDGTATVTYYGGQADWAPIMGVGYYEPIVQWSRGEYTGANNTEDDFAVMQSYGAPLRSDDYGSTLVTASPLPVGGTAAGLIETRADKDVFSISHTCSGTLSVQVTPAPISPNLDVQLRLLNASGTVLMVNDPPSATIDQDRASGLSAAVSSSLPAGTYYVEVDGVGNGGGLTGYSDYASVGRYTLGVTQCGALGPPTGVTATKNDTAHSATLSWQPPASDGGSAITGYLVARDGFSAGGNGTYSKIVTPDTRSFTFQSLIPGSTYNLTVSAINGNGAGPAASAPVTFSANANLLKNPGFETDANADTRPDSWTSSAKFTRSNTVIHTGSYSGRHRATDNSGNTISQTVTGLTAGTAYVFSGWVNIPATSDTFTYSFKVKWRSSSNATLRTDVVKTWSSGTTGWIQVAKFMTSPTSATNAQVQLVASSLNGNIYADDTALRRT